MASLLSGITFLENFGFYSVVFPFLLIFAIVYGILSKVQPFGKDVSINVIVSLVIAFMLISFAPAITFIRYIVPYFALFFVVILFILMMFQFLGVKSDTLQEAFVHPGVYGTIIVVMLIGTFLFISESFPELSITKQDGTSTSSDVMSGEDEMVVSESGSETTIIIDNNDEVSKRQFTLRNTVFHPTILALLVLVMVFGAAVYMIAIIDRE